MQSDYNSLRTNHHYHPLCRHLSISCYCKNSSWKSDCSRHLWNRSLKQNSRYKFTTLLQPRCYIPVVFTRRRQLQNSNGHITGNVRYRITYWQQNINRIRQIDNKQQIEKLSLQETAKLSKLKQGEKKLGNEFRYLE